MIQLTKRNGERFLVNHTQIESIEMIPESKIVMMNRDYFIVRESPEQIIKRIAEYRTCAGNWTSSTGAEPPVTGHV